MKITLEIGQNNPILRKKSVPIKKHELHIFKKIGENMVNYIKNPKNQWIWLAWPQIWLDKRIIVVWTPKKDTDEAYQVIYMVNPVILANNGEMSAAEEGCLSLPWLRWNVMRYNEIEVEWIDGTGKKMRKKCSWLWARVIQHEIDHLDGIMICDKFLK